jgi:DNA-binding CsgD family transcriptional regulator
MEDADRAVLGRDAELAELRRFIGSVPSGPTAIVFEGTAGIGKTTLWLAGVNAATDQGYRVLSTRAAEAEARLSYTALGDLLDRVIDDARSLLPSPQLRALDAALLRGGSERSRPDQRAVSLATLEVLRILASSGPVIVAIDDVQWLDAPSARVLAFAVRRLSDEPIGLMCSLRLGSDSPGDPLDLDRALPDPNIRRLRVGPMDLEALGRLVRERTDTDLPRPILLRLHRVSGGNPFFALQVARAIAREGRRPEPGRPLPVPEDLHELLGAQLATLSTSARHTLLAAAVASRPTQALIVAVAGRHDRAMADLAEAEHAGIVEHGGERIRFSHPLFASTVYASSRLHERQDAHRRLADLVSDPEERARHLALAADRPDPDVARALDEAARHARARGAPDAAAELAELARRASPADDVEGLRRRSLEAAEYHFDAGDAARASTLLEDVIASSPPGPGRAEVLYRLSSMSWMNLERGVRRPLEQALPEAGDDPELLAGIHLDLAWVAIYRGDLVTASDHATKSVGHANAMSDPSTKSDALATFATVEFLLGRSADQLMTEALELQDFVMRAASWTEGSVYTTPRSMLGLQLMWAGRLDEAREVLQHELAEYDRLSMYTVRQEVLCYLAELECRAGRWQIAARHAAEAAETVTESGMAATQSHVVLFNQAMAAAHLGEVEIARGQATEGLRLATENDDAFNAAWNGAVLGFLELSLSNHEAAHAHLQPVLRYLDRLGSVEPGIIPCIPDDIEALVSLGRLDEAEDELERLRAQGRARDRPWALAAAARCEGLLAAARGDLEMARSALERAEAEHQRAPQPFELARTLMVRGEVERRNKQKRAAREFLGRAMGTFDQLGAPLWSAKAATELARVGGAATPEGGLTPTERRVSQLVFEGKTNREVADALFVSVKTVEANITRIFRKMGVTSRAQLIHAMATASSPGNPSAASPTSADGEGSGAPS